MISRHGAGARHLAWLFAIAVGACSPARDHSSPTAPSTFLPSETMAARAVTLVDVQNGVDVTAGTVGTWNSAGQSVTVPGTGTFGAITFAWYLKPAAPTAFGTLYVLDREYLGVPGGLSEGTPGLLARSDRQPSGFVNGGLNQGAEYVLPPTLALTGGATYWFYTDTPGSFTGSFDEDIYPGGAMYVSGHPTVAFHRVPASGRMTAAGVYVPPPPGVTIDANFRLRGTPR